MFKIPTGCSITAFYNSVGCLNIGSIFRNTFENDEGLHLYLGFKTCANLKVLLPEYVTAIDIIGYSNYWFLWFLLLITRVALYWEIFEIWGVDSKNNTEIWDSSEEAGETSIESGESSTASGTTCVIGIDEHEFLG